VYRIRKIDLISGGDVIPGDLMVAIGPNNGGKSQFLKDLVSAIAYPTRPMASIQRIHPEFPRGANCLLDKITKQAEKDESGNFILDAPAPDLNQPLQLRLAASQIGRATSAQLTEDQAIAILKDNLGRHLVSHLTTERRLLLLKRQDNRQQNIEGAQTPLEAAFAAPHDLIASMNKHVQLAFGTDLILDDTVFATAQFRVGHSNEIPTALDERRQYVRQLPTLDNQGDGIRSFCGTLVTAAAFERPILAIDEPEAFLHPPQAYLLGRALGELRGKAQLFVATHSAEVLRGILSIYPETTVVRFASLEKRFSTKSLSPGDLQAIINDPLLSSVRVLDGLFYNGVAVTESDGDVVLYRSVLDQIDQSASIEFVNSYDKRASAKIAAPYRAMGVPCALIVDFDILRVREDLKALYEAVGGRWSDIEQDYTEAIRHIEKADNADAQLQSALDLLASVSTEVTKQGTSSAKLAWLRNRLKDVRDRAVVWGTLKSQGEAGLTAIERRHYDKIIKRCNQLGLYIASAGEREAWLTPDIAYTNNKRHWTKLALEYISNNGLSERHRLRVFVSKIRSFCLGITSTASAMPAPQASASVDSAG
jgi:hypothetical protein